MEAKQEKGFLDTLRRELVPALGCTEPIAIAYASAKAREVLGRFPERIEIRCSGNIVKNVKSVTVPNSGGMKGIGAAAVLGVVGGDASKELEVLKAITPEQILRAKELLKGDYFSCSLQENVDNLYIAATAVFGEHAAQVTIVNRHTLIARIVKDGRVVYEEQPVESQDQADWSGWSIRSILDFAEHVELRKVEELLDRQIAMNSEIAEAGLAHPYGTQIGRTLLEVYGDNVQARAKAYAAAGSDARMGGCSLPVVINSGSGNQGMTVSLPVLAYAKEWQASREACLRALLISNLVSIYQKHYIGSLSSFCGAVTAACGCGAAITYLAGGGYEEICRTIVNTAANVGGIVCDGAKPSCAAKIASAVDAAILAHHLSMKGLCFRPGEGIVRENIEETIQSIGYIGRVGMQKTDRTILNLMMEQASR